MGALDDPIGFSNPELGSLLSGGIFTGSQRLKRSRAAFLFDASGDGAGVTLADTEPLFALEIPFTLVFKKTITKVQNV